MSNPFSAGPVRYTRSGVPYTARPSGGDSKAARKAAYAAGRPSAYVGAVNYRPITQISPTETKYFDTSLLQTIAFAADWTGTEVPATNYIQSDGTTVGNYTDSALIPSAIGSGYGQVNGNKYYLKHIRIKGCIIPSVTVDSADVLTARTTRLVLVEDTQPQGSQAQGENVFTDMGTSTQNNYSFLAMAAGSGGRFRILKDKLFIHQPANAGTDGANTNSVVNSGNTFKFNVKFAKPRQVILKANSSVPTVASLSNCNIFLLAHTDATAVITACSRAYYCD